LKLDQPHDLDGSFETDRQVEDENGEQPDDDPESLKLDFDDVQAEHIEDFPEAVTESKTLDDFGDFANFEQVGWTSTEANEEENKFHADFEERSELVLDDDEGNLSQPKEDNPDVDDDDDDFGDFDSATDQITNVGVSSPRSILSAVS